MSKIKNQSGQILLVTLLVLSVALTIALSLIGRTTLDTNISSQVEEASRAFSAAEAGIEEALFKGAVPAGPVPLAGSNTTYTVTKDTIVAQGNTSYTVGLVGNGEAKSIWLVRHDPITGQPMYTDPQKYSPGDPISICWTDEGGQPAMEVTVYYITSAGLYRTAKIGYDPFSRVYNLPGESNQFTGAVNSGNCNPGGVHISTLNFNSLGIANLDTMILMRLRPVYNSANIYINPSEDLPGLGNDYVSCGASVPEVTRCISATQLYPEPPDVFDYVLYANNGSIQ